MLNNISKNGAFGLGAWGSGKVLKGLLLEMLCDMAKIF